MKNRSFLKATPNHSKRTFTIRYYSKGGIYLKFRTFKMDSDEFNEALHNTEYDWDWFLRSSNNYFKV